MSGRRDSLTASFDTLRPGEIGGKRRPSRASLTIALFDALTALAVWLTVAAIARVSPPKGVLAQVGLMAAVFVICPLALWAVGAYQAARAWMTPVSRVVLGATLSVWLGWLILRAAGGDESVAALIATWCSLAVSLITVRRGIASWAPPERVLLVGGGLAAQRFAAACRRSLGGRMTIVGYVDDRAIPTSRVVLRRLGHLNRLEHVISAHGVDRVVIAFTRRSDLEILELIRACDRSGVTVDIMPRFFDLIGHRPRTYNLGYLSMVTVAAPGRSRGFRRAKRCIDLAGAALLLVCLAPLLALVAMAILIEDGRPMFFTQSRVGLGGVPFRIIKFRTMHAEMSTDLLVEAREAAARTGTVTEAVNALKTTLAPEVTRVGRVLRRSSLDELPQLVNVLAGDMSLVGPRPLRQFEVDALTGWQRSRLGVRPGMSGLWQVFGRSEVEWEERVQLDDAYVRHASLRADAEIVARTLAAVIRGKGAR